MTRDALKKYRNKMEKEQVLETKKIVEEKQKKQEQYNTLDDIVMILYDENIKSKTVREVKCKKEFVNYLILKYNS